MVLNTEHTKENVPTTIEHTVITDVVQGIVPGLTKEIVEPIPEPISLPVTDQQIENVQIVQQISEPAMQKNIEVEIQQPIVTEQIISNEQMEPIVQEIPFVDLPTIATQELTTTINSNSQGTGSFAKHAHWAPRSTDFDQSPQIVETTLQQTEQPEGTTSSAKDDLEKICCCGKGNIWGLSKSHELYHLVSANGTLEWQYYPTEGKLFKDISCVKHDILFAIGANDGLLYRLSNKIELVIPSDTTRLISISAMTKRKIYAISETNQIMVLRLKHLVKKPQWELMGGKLNKIAAGGRHVIRRSELWGIGLDNRAYRWDGTIWVPFNIEVLDISVAVDNAVYGVRKQDGRLVKWDGWEQFLLQEMPNTNENAHYAKLTSVAAYREGKHVYAVEAGTSNVLRMMF
jgi:hypothetical protein